MSEKIEIPHQLLHVNSDLEDLLSEAWGRWGYETMTYDRVRDIWIIERPRQ